MNTTIKSLIWIYAILILLEGALRKWFLPGMSEILLIVRDPVLLLIFALALAKGTFPINKWMAVIGLLAVASVGSSFLGGCDNVIVILYGLRINYLHLPLIWIIAEHFDRRDVERLGACFLLLAVPITILMVVQFQSSPLDWINKGVGMDEGGQLFGAEGRVRPPGPFAFITGPQVYFPLCAAFLFAQIDQKERLKLPLLIASACALLVALPISISRTVMLATVIVGLVYLGTLLFTGKTAAKFVKPLFIFGAVAVLALQLPIFDDALRVFGTRWEQAAASTEGRGWDDVIDRTLKTFTNPIQYAMDAPAFGEGIGMGSNVAARLMRGTMGFLLAEEEYAKIYMELGFLVGTAFIALRIGLFLYLLAISWHSLRHDHFALPILILSSISTIILFGQWAPPTILGFTVLGSGLILAAAKQQHRAEMVEPFEPTSGKPKPAVHNEHRLPRVPRTRSATTPTAEGERV